MKLNSIAHHSTITNNIEKIHSMNKISTTKTNNFEKTHLQVC
ncbi:hypothetical protein [Anaerophilus nitritogenes]|nr:hypothetical protein [Anaerophilus nitritogenes]